MDKLRHIECVCDLCGNWRNPGFDADVYESPSGERFLILGGGWEYYDPRFAAWVAPAKFAVAESIEALHAVFDRSFQEIGDYLQSLAGEGRQQ